MPSTIPTLSLGDRLRIARKLDDVLPFALEDLAARLEGQGALRWFWRLA